ncbi:MAG TPA: hypothetical protein VFV22_01225 [Candidatus Paceibacterota bacterium]|nr:hypothetical protein [Candidatus Paceibacterota bacterium]
MSRYRNFSLFLGFVLFTCGFTLTHAEEVYTAIPSPYEPTPFRFTNENWLILPHPKIASFIVHPDGNASGITETGITFAQYNIPNAYGVRIQRFEIQDHYHYIIDGVDVYTITDLAIRLAQISAG